MYVCELGVDHTETELRSRTWGNTNNKDYEEEESSGVLEVNKMEEFKKWGINIVKFHKDVKSD